MRIDDVGVTFVNAVVNQGMFDGVFNINFATFLFTPTQERINDEGKRVVEVEPDLTVSCRLRMGEQCLRQLHQTVGNLLALLEEQRTTPAAKGAAEKPN